MRSTWRRRGIPGIGLFVLCCAASLTACSSGDVTRPQRVASTVSVTGGGAVLSAGTEHTCATLADGAARCWGRNSTYQLGDGTNAQRTTPVPVNGMTDVAEVAAGGNHTCARKLDGTVWCWGNNGSGQLGDGTTTGSTTPGRATPAPVVGLTDAVRIGCASGFSCALRDDGTVWCWGANENGQLGDGTTAGKTTPVRVGELRNVVDLSVGLNHACAVRANGTAWCWGYNAYGQLGDGTTTSRGAPAQVAGLTGVARLTAGHMHTCAVLRDGTARCWGANAKGQLGDGTWGNRLTPAPVAGLTDVRHIAAGGLHTCAVLHDGTARCWGLDVQGQVGDGATTSTTTTGPNSYGIPMPTPVLNLSDAVYVAAGYMHSCALRSDGTARCWGYNNYGQLGTGGTTRRLEPASVTNLAGAAIPAAPAATPATLFGFANVGGLYRREFEKNLLTEGADRAAALGNRTQFVYLSALPDRYPNGSAAGQAWDGVERMPRETAQLPLFDAYLARPELDLVTLTVYTPGQHWFPPGVDVEATDTFYQHEEDQLYNLTRHLLERFNGTGKTFVLKNWEGDWHLLELHIPEAERHCTNPRDANGVPVPTADASVACARNMVRWLRARQRGVTRARNDVAANGGSTARVYLAVEVNRVREATGAAGALRLVNLLPYVGADMVSCSAWDSMAESGTDYASVTAGLDDAMGLLLSQSRQLAINTERGFADAAGRFPASLPESERFVAQPEDPQNLGTRRLLLAEFGVKENVTSQAEVDYRLRATVDTARAWQVRASYFWQLYDNECTVQDSGALANCAGLMLYRPDGSRSWALDTLLGTAGWTDPGEQGPIGLPPPQSAPDARWTEPSVMYAGGGTNGHPFNNLVWNPAPGATEYVVTVMGPGGLTLRVNTSTRNWYTLSPALPAGSYTWTVRARGTGFSPVVAGNAFQLVTSP